MSRSCRVVRVLVAQFVLIVAVLSTHAAAAERLCDTAYEDCRRPLIALINAERVGIDVGFWMMEDYRYADALIARHNAGVRVRVLADLTANSPYPDNALILTKLKNARIPIRDCITSGILHWKAMIFQGQNTVEFSGANFTPTAFAFGLKYTDYVDEAIYFTDDPAVVNSFKTEYDNLWLSDSKFRDLANVRRPLTREHPVYLKDPELNFAPTENFATRSVAQYRAETRKIDAIIYRITDRRHSDEMIAAVKRGVPVRLITEPKQYRDPTRLWHSWNVDRMYMGGVQVRHRRHQGLTHQKSTLLYSQGLTVFGSSNWTSPSANSQHEHNYFTRKQWFFNWFWQQFERKWNNLAGFAETEPFVPLAPAAPSYVSPASGATGQATTSLKLQWKPGYWAHKADVYFGTSSNPPLLKRDVSVAPSSTAGYVLPTLVSGRTYYWKIVSKTMANKTATGAVRSFTTR